MITADALYKHIDPGRPQDDLSELIRLSVYGIITDVPEPTRELLSAT